MTLVSGTTSPFMHPWFCAFMDMGPIMVPKLDWVIVFMSWYIRCQPQWASADKSQWQNELRVQVQKTFECIDDALFDKLFKYAVRELQWFHQLETKFPGLNGQFKIQFDDKIVASDSVIPVELRNDLKFQSIRLQSSFDHERASESFDHRQTVDLIHPSLLPFQYNRSPIIRNNKVRLLPYFDKIPKFKMGVSKHLYKKNFQWLPTLFKYDASDRTYRIVSYINSLHPVNFHPLYDVIETVFNLSLPGLELVLSRFQSEQITRTKVPNPFDPYEEPYQTLVKQLSPDDVDYQEKVTKLKKKYVKPLRINYKPYKTDHLNLRATFKHLKVIPKLANIALTPDDPSFHGGAWHVDGTINEDIVATIVFNYDSNNITDSTISFKAAYDEPFYERGDDFFVKEFFGIEDNDPLYKVLGSVKFPENRLLIFPNIFQRRLDPFELKDKSKPGHRKMLFLHIVDPYNDLVVTTNEVPPQQRSWWEDKTLEYLIPAQLKNKILSVAKGWPESSERSEYIREQIREERYTRDEAEGDESDDEDDFLTPFQRCFHTY